ncbi:MAG: ABC transporter ATP-binding protein [Candidatus Eremiobacteraeota bacterium]|nr:ABC transporter ATP-binding protein [Candidatus Eremiobacteraeota bacterium]
MLEVENLHVGYGEIAVLEGATLRVGRGEIVALLGANGAGKTTLMRAISRLLPPTAGTMTFEERDLLAASPARAVEWGIAHVPEGRKLWPDMSVEDNLLLGSYPKRARAQAAASLEEVYALFPRVKERRRQTAGTLSGGEQQMVAIGRCLMSLPSLLMLDEPSLGLAPKVVGEVFASIRAINARGMTVLLVEQNVAGALELASRGYVLETGRIVMTGSREELLASEMVRKAYLGL